MNWPFSWKAGSDRIRCLTSSSLAVMPSRSRLGERDLLLDQLLHDPLVDAQLVEQPVVHVGAVGRPVGLHLAGVGPAELADGDVLAVDGGDHLAEAGAGAIVRPRGYRGR